MPDELNQQSNFMDSTIRKDETTIEHAETSFHTNTVNEKSENPIKFQFKNQNIHTSNLSPINQSTE